MFLLEAIAETAPIGANIYADIVTLLGTVVGVIYVAFQSSKVGAIVNTLNTAAGREPLTQDQISAVVEKAAQMAVSTVQQSKPE